MDRRSFLLVASAGVLSSTGFMERNPIRHTAIQSRRGTDARKPTSDPNCSTAVTGSPRTSERRNTGHDIVININRSISDSQLALRATILASFDRNHPARLTVELQNTSDNPLTVICGSTPPISDYVGQQPESDARLLLIPDNRTALGFEGTERDGDPFVPEQAQKDCWRAQHVPIAPDIADETQLVPNECLAHTYTVVAHPENGGCIPSGDYRFEIASYHKQTSQTPVLTVTVLA